jgi:hypothetical protein
MKANSNAQAVCSRQQADVGRLLPAAFCLLLALLLSGCDEELNTLYGQREGMGTDSVNGTAVLSKLFERAGHTVYSWGSLSPRLKDRADCIVWFPNDFKPPSKEVQRWLEGWLEAKRDRTLVYVGRDFDAAPRYWSAVLPGAAADQQAEVRRRKEADEAAFAAARKEVPANAQCSWFTIDGLAKPRKVESLDGVPEWLEGVDASKTEIEVLSRLEATEYAESLLESDGHVLVGRLEWRESQVIVVANGSFLLNLPLVNHEHRKLAARLVAEIGTRPKTVVFLESRAGGPPIREEDPLVTTPSGIEVFNLWPTGWILLHFAAAGIILCFCRYPIFGQPREPQPESPSDFGKHIQAVGELLARTGGASFAQARLAHYRQVTDNREEGRNRRSGVSPLPPRVEGKRPL